MYITIYIHVHTVLVYCTYMFTTSHIEQYFSCIAFCNWFFFCIEAINCLCPILYCVYEVVGNIYQSVRQSLIYFPFLLLVCLCVYCISVYMCTYILHTCMFLLIVWFPVYSVMSLFAHSCLNFVVCYHFVYTMYMYLHVCTQYMSTRICMYVSAVT